MESVMEPTFNKASGLYYKWQWQSLGLSVFLEKIEPFLINMKILLMSVTESVLQPVFGEASGLY